MGLIKRKIQERTNPVTDKAPLVKRDDQRLDDVAGGGRDPNGQHIPPRMQANASNLLANDVDAYLPITIDLTAPDA